MNMTEGTIFSKWVPAAATGLYVFVGRGGYRDDFIFRDLLPSPANVNESKFDPILEADDETYRWGINDPGQQFAVYEGIDCHRMECIFNTAKVRHSMFVGHGLKVVNGEAVEVKKP